MYLIVLCFVLHQIVGLKLHGYDHKSLAILFVGLKTRCYAQYQMHIENIRKHLRRSLTEKVNGYDHLLHSLKMTLKASVSANVIDSFRRKGFHMRSFLDVCKCSEYTSGHS